jgi:hypothetical protein
VYSENATEGNTMKTTIKSQYEEPRVSAWYFHPQSPRGFSIGD